MTVLDAILGVAVACGVAGALTGNRTAWALLASVAYCLAMDWLGVAFNPFLWLMVDLAVCLAILLPVIPKFARFFPKLRVSSADVAILALFGPAWIGYLMEPDVRYQIGFAVVVTQLLVTFPSCAAWRLLTRASSDMAGKDDFDLMAVA